MANTVDPLAGSYYVEARTNRMGEEVYQSVLKIESLGGRVGALE